MFIMCRCQETCEDVGILVARGRHGMLYRRCGKKQTYKYADRLSNTNAHRTTHTQAFTHSKPLHIKTSTHRRFYT